jgi:glutaminase
MSGGQRITERLHELYERHREIDRERLVHYYESGRGYYPLERAGPERDVFAISLMTLDGKLRSVGDHTVAFALYSVSKVFTYALALTDNTNAHVLERVGVEPSGDAYNSIVFDERNHRPYNPMVNAGALVTCELVRGASHERKAERVVDFMGACAGDDDIGPDPRTLSRELRTADRNRATAYLLRSEGMLEGAAEEVLAQYLTQCSVTVTTGHLAAMGATLAGGGVNPATHERVMPLREVRDVLSVMHTCGMYDAAGSWAFEVGVPAKSGVGGAILAVVPGKGGVAVYSPGLDVYGNSVRGVAVCRDVATRLGLHVFAMDEEDALLGPAAPAA